MFPLQDAEGDTEVVRKHLSLIDFLERKGLPSRIVAAYEDALTAVCLQADLWQRFLNYLTKNFRSADSILPQCRRAIRNCPWSLALWLTEVRKSGEGNELKKGRKVEPWINYEINVDYVIVSKMHDNSNGRDKKSQARNGRRRKLSLPGKKSVRRPYMHVTKNPILNLSDFTLANVLITVHHPLRSDSSCSFAMVTLYFEAWGNVLCAES